MSASEYQPNVKVAATEAAPAEVSETERRARQIAQLVEAERRRRRRTIVLCLGLLVVPVAIAAAGLLLAREGKSVSAEDLRQQMEPMVESKVGEQMRPVVEEKFGDRIDTIVEAKVGEKVQGASPAAVREISESVEQVRRDLSQVRAGVEGVQELKAALPQIRTQLDAQGNYVREIQQRITRLPNGGDPGSPALAAEFKQLQGRLGQLEQRLERSVTSLSTKMDESSKQMRALAAKLSTTDKRNLPESQHAPAPKKQR